ncbi:biofilm-forming protein [Peribacillus deserti]|uniref:Biofilm-forming protein n=1 Tax=Peribacillus deserti TaxID=673318 RepID=A0A2N5MAX1_9BACI|nr:biofilm-forming protein [Peribacillus deserti]PLT31518.1 biofilm-forming protein [Peribacillus deserti]
MLEKGKENTSLEQRRSDQDSQTGFRTDKNKQTKKNK